ncbi:unnamed protein product [Phytomonas sp. Hart1]|nr:unnamed protein product [Phytomonas sp. Hart1]|eukprot:CCW72138.1 unnamed protein product [Phytomonas sp. isolate Hart1]
MKVQNSFEEAIYLIESEPLKKEENHSLKNKFHLRPSEELALLIADYNNPPPPRGTKINLSRSFFGSEKCLILGRKLNLNRTVTFIDISFCDIQEDVAQKFFHLIKHNTALRYVNINCNCIGDKGASAAAESFDHLETFHASSNGISDIGASQIAEALITSPTMKTLNLRWNKITMIGMMKLMQVLDSSYTVDTEGASTHNNQEETSKSDFIESKPLVQENDHINYHVHTLWIQGNEGATTDIVRSLNIILSNRFPQPPSFMKNMMKTKGKKKKK